MYLQQYEIAAKNIERIYILHILLCCMLMKKLFKQKNRNLYVLSYILETRIGSSYSL